MRLILYLDTLPLTTSKSLFYHQCTSLLIHTTTILCISIIEDHSHFCVPSHHHPNTNTPPHIQLLLLDNGRHFFYPQNITTHTTTMQDPLPNQTSSTLPYSPLSLFQSIHKETKTVERNEMRFHIDENHNIKLLPQSTPLQEHTEVYLVVVRGVGGIRKRSSSKTSFP